MPPEIGWIYGFIYGSEATLLPRAAAMAAHTGRWGYARWLIIPTGEVLVLEPVCTRMMHTHIKLRIDASGC